MASASATTCPHGLLWSGDQRVSAHLTLNMEAQLDEIERIRAAVNILSQAERWPPELLFQIELVLEEVGTNIIKYGQDDERETDIDITLTSDRKSLTLEIVDNGKPFNPFADAPPPDLDSAVPERPIGGLGVYLVQELMDEASYRHEDGKNKVTLVKHKSL